MTASFDDFTSISYIICQTYTKQFIGDILLAFNKDSFTSIPPTNRNLLDFQSGPVPKNHHPQHPPIRAQTARVHPPLTPTTVVL